MNQEQMLREVGAIRRAIKMLVIIECSECDEAATSAIPLNGDLLAFRLDFSQMAWKYGWIVEDDKVHCPDCRYGVEKEGAEHAAAEPAKGRDV